MECEKCGANEFQEEDGFYFCIYCQTQSQGFAKEVAGDENEFHITREVRIKSSLDADKNIKKRTREGLSRWNTIEAFNEVYLGFIEDFFRILRVNNLKISESLFKSISMKIWFKYLRESEIAFFKNEHCSNAKTKLHPSSRYRDNFLLGSANTNSTDNVPYYQKSESSQSNKMAKECSFGSFYSARPSNKLLIKNNEYFNDDIYSVKYKDPRNYLRTNTSNDRIKPSIVLNDVFLEKGKQEKKLDPFLKHVLHLLNNDAEIKSEEEDDSPNNDRVESMIVENEFFDDSNYDQILKERMSSKLKSIEEFIPFKKFKQASNNTRMSPISNDLPNKHKLVSFLYITIRLLNYNIYLSDLLRWCSEGSIRYLNSLAYLPKEWEIMWIDLSTFRTNLFPAYHHIIGVVKNMTIHCKIDYNLFPTPDLYCLIKRYIKDLNLPRGLLNIVVNKYGPFIEFYREHFCRPNFASTTEYDLIAIFSVILTLRDLFDLLGSTEENFNLFKNKSKLNLFVWSEWLDYSKFRLNLIKTFNLNIRLRNDDNLLNIDELLSSSEVWNNFFQDKNDIISLTKRKKRQHEHRYNLQNSFEKLFFVDQNLNWKEQIENDSKNSNFPSFYPLTQLTNSVASKITNDRILKKLNTSFRNKLITPYVCLDGFHFHRRITLLTDHPEFKSYNFSFIQEHTTPSFQHLIELASLITYADVRRFMYLFVKAENMAFRDKVK